MDKFSLGEKFRLELHWEKVVYEKDGVCFLKGAYFSGPVLKQAQKLNNNDHILLDFFQQYFVVVNNVYVAKLSWGEVEYNNNVVVLKEAKILHDTELNKAPKLNDNDYLVIDTKGHEVEEHPFNPVYKTYVVNNDTQLYRFGG